MLQLNTTCYNTITRVTGGAKYYGEIVDFKRQGRGIMTYPDGDLYDGNLFLQ